MLYDFSNPNGNGKRPSTQFWENNEIVFHLVAMSQCEQGGEGRIWDLAHVDKVKFKLVRFGVKK